MCLRGKGDINPWGFHGLVAILRRWCGGTKTTAQQALRISVMGEDSGIEAGCFSPLPPPPNIGALVFRPASQRVMEIAKALKPER